MGKKTQSTKDIALNAAEYRKFLANAAEGLPIRKWEPLKSWPYCPHPNPDVQKRLDEYRSIPSVWSK